MNKRPDIPADPVESFRREVDDKIHRQGLDTDVQALSRIWVRETAPTKYSYNLARPAHHSVPAGHRRAQSGRFSAGTATACLSATRSRSIPNRSMSATAIGWSRRCSTRRSACAGAGDDRTRHQRVAILLSAVGDPGVSRTPFRGRRARAQSGMTPALVDCVCSTLMEAIEQLADAPARTSLGDR
jgi:hypothetical protein